MNPELRTPAPKKIESHGQLPEYSTRMQNAEASKQEIQTFIAQLATSERPGQPAVASGDVFLYPTGMNAIYSLSESLVSLESGSQVAAYGWLYPETVEVLRRGAWKNILSFKDGTEKELDQLESMLLSGQRIHTLLCELPSNIKLSSPNLHRIRALADQYGFIVACDDTVAGYVNIDALPYVDVMMSSLTKTFSGSSNVTGGRYVSEHPSIEFNHLTRLAWSSTPTPVIALLSMLLSPPTTRTYISLLISTRSCITAKTLPGG